jgi:formate dehydrogenase subunit delta
LKTEHLITMANQIGSFFNSYPDTEQAKKDIAKHIKRFWAPTMCKQIIEHVSQQGSGLEPMVESAIKEHLSPDFLVS